jgi:hypothetical protein
MGWFVDILYWLAHNLHIEVCEKIADYIVSQLSGRYKRCVNCLWRSPKQRSLFCVKCSIAFDKYRQTSIDALNTKYDADKKNA